MNDRQFVSKALNRSGNEVPMLTYHGTSPDAFLDILRSGGLEPGEATPAGVYLCPDARTADASMYNRGLLVACKTRGFPFHYEASKKHLHDKNTIPNGCIG